MAHKQTTRRSSTDFRRRSQLPLPAGAEVEHQLRALRSPSLLAPRQLERRDPRHPQRLIRLRPRLLTRPVLGALVVGLGWRRVPAVAEGQQVLAREGLLWIPPLQGRPHAITTRREVLPAAVRGPLWTEVCPRLQAHAAPSVFPPSWAPVREHVPLIAIVEGSTVEARHQRTQVLRARDGVRLAGKTLVMGDAFSHRPRWQLSTAAAAAHDQRFAAESLAALPVGGLWVVELGLFSFLWCDDFTGAQQFFVTRRRAKTAYRTVQVRSGRPYDRDERLHVGQYRSNPCTSPLRLVSVRWQGTWQRDLTKVLDPHGLSARQVCALSRRRWRIEEAFALTTRLLALAYVGTGSTNAVQWQLSATLVFSAVLVTICQQVAQALGEPLERLAGERVCRAFSHDSRAVPRGACDDLVALLVEHATLLGLVKRRRKQHRERQQLESIMWGDP